MNMFKYASVVGLCAASFLIGCKDKGEEVKPETGKTRYEILTSTVWQEKGLEDSCRLDDYYTFETNGFSFFDAGGTDCGVGFTDVVDKFELIDNENKFVWIFEDERVTLDIVSFSEEEFVLYSTFEEEGELHEVVERFVKVKDK